MFRQNEFHWGWFDTLALVCFLSLLGFITYRVEVGLEYNWNWSVIPQYILRYDSTSGWVPNLLLTGLLTTIRLSFWSLCLAIPLGLICGLFRTSIHLFNRLFGGLYVNLLRNLPPLVLVFIFYFFVSDQILPYLELPRRLEMLPDTMTRLVSFCFAPVEQIEAFFAAVVTLALLEAAYIAEIVRAGINSIETGQWEAAYSVGLRRWQVMRHIVLPQACVRMIPPLAGQVISTIKDSAIVSVISIQELTFQGMELMASTYLTFEVWITVTVLYFVLTFSCSKIADQLESRFQRI